MNSRCTTTIAFSIYLFSIAGLPAVAQDEPEAGEEEPRWAFTGELSLVDTGGNSETSTVGLGVKAARTDEGGGKLELAAGGLRVETTTTSRFAVGTADVFEIIEQSTTETTAENYHLKGRYDRKISERLFWFLGAGWERNEFAGFDSRSNLAAGVGHLWFENDRGHLRTDYSITYTRQDDLVDDPTTEDGFLGLRLGFDYLRNISETTNFESVLVVDANADESEDLRADFSNALSVSVSDRLALKVGLQLLFDNLPSLTQVPLVDSAGVPTGISVAAELDDLDTKLTVTLVLER